MNFPKNTGRGMPVTMPATPIKLTAVFIKSLYPCPPAPRYY
jgi:hypothetical protein